MTIDDTINYQAYGGYDWYPNATAAVDETKGEVLTYNHALISAVYSASNGGKTELNSNVWGGNPAAYLTIKDDPFDAKIPWNISIKKMQIDPTVTTWTNMKESDTTITNNIKTWMSSHGFAGKEIKITSIPVLYLHNPTSGGRVSKGDITVNFFTKDGVDIDGKYIPQQLVYQNVAASQIRAMVGIQNMLSYLVANQTVTNDFITITGLGNGHGVGMSQWGAKNRADAGQNYRDILSFYYDGTLIEKKYSARPTYIAPASDTTAVVTNQPNTAGTTPTSEIETVKISTPIISSVTANYDGINSQISLNYSINQDVLATIYIKDGAGKIVTYLKKSEKQTTGKQNVLYKTTNLPNGAYTFGISVTNTDQLSASAVKTITVNKVVSKPSVNAISDKDSTISGTAIPNAQIIVSGNKVIASTKTNSAGKYTLSIPKQKAGTILSVIAKDSIGNASSPSVVTVLDKTAPAVPKVYAISNRDTFLTGLAEAGATVTVKSGSKIIGTGKADGNGKFRIAIPKQKAHTVLTVSAKDKANNVSPTIAFKVMAK
jgi:SpoIID/LytB domain protein